MKLTLKPIYIKKLTLLLYFQFLNRFITEVMQLLENKPLNNDAWTKRFVAFLPRFAVLDRAVKQIMAHELSKKIALADGDSDFCISAFGSNLKAAGKTKDSDRLDAFDRLSALFKTFSGVTMASLSYEEQTASVANFVNDALDPLKKFKADLELLGLTSYVLDMQAANVAFSKLFSERLSDVAAKEVFDTKALRLELNEEYNDLAEHILSMAKFYPEEEVYGAMLEVINQIRKYYADLLAGKAGTAAAAKAKAAAKEELMINN